MTRNSVILRQAGELAIAAAGVLWAMGLFMVLKPEISWPGPLPAAVLGTAVLVSLIAAVAALRTRSRHNG